MGRKVPTVHRRLSAQDVRALAQDAVQTGSDMQHFMVKEAEAALALGSAARKLKPALAKSPCVVIVDHLTSLAMGPGAEDMIQVNALPTDRQ